jgi:hypothetical protein
MFLDLQFSEAKFLELLTDQVQRALPLVSDEFDDPLGSSDKLMIDHLDVTGITVDSSPSTTVTVAAPSGPTNITGKVLRLKIDIAASLTTRAKVIAAGHLGVPALQSFGLWVKADVRARADGGSLVLSVTPVEVGSVIDVLSDDTKQQLLANVPSLDQSVTLPDVAGHPMNVTNAGLMRVGDAIEILAQLTLPGSGTVEAWKNFFAGQLTPRSSEWSILLPKELIIDIVDETITEAVDSLPEENPHVEILKQPSTSWWFAGPVSTATINAKDACPVGGSDIEVDLTFVVTFALSGGEIEVTIDVSWNLNDVDVAKCGLATVVLPGAIVTVIAGVVGGPVAAVVGAVATIIAFIVGVVMISDKAHGELSDGISGLDPGDMDLKIISQDDDHAVIRGHVALGTVLSGMMPTSIVAVPTGLLLAGSLGVPGHQERSLKLIAQGAFGWQGGYSCSKKAWAPEEANAKLSMQDPSNYPVSGTVEVLTDPPSDYIATLTSWYGPAAGFALSVQSTIPGGTGPDCTLLIRTNSGARYANLGRLPPPPKTPSQEELLMLKISCYKQAHPGPKKWLEARWLIDPPPDAVVNEHLNVWDAVLSKVAPRTPVELAVIERDQHSPVIATVEADMKGMATFRIATVRGQSIAVSAPIGLESASLFVGGAMLERVSCFVPRVSAVDATIVNTGAQPRVLIAAGAQVLLMTVDGTALGKATVPGVTRVGVTGNRMTAFAGSRLVTLALDGRRLRPIPEDISQMKQTHVWPPDLRPASAGPDKRPGRWIAERWLDTPMRVGNYVARVQEGAVVVYRYAQTAVF